MRLHRGPQSLTAFSPVDGRHHPSGPALADGYTQRHRPLMPCRAALACAGELQGHARRGGAEPQALPPLRPGNLQGTRSIWPAPIRFPDVSTSKHQHSQDMRAHTFLPCMPRPSLSLCHVTTPAPTTTPIVGPVHSLRGQVFHANGLRKTNTPCTRQCSYIRAALHCRYSSYVYEVHTYSRPGSKLPAWAPCNPISRNASHPGLQACALY